MQKQASGKTNKKGAKMKPYSMESKTVIEDLSSSVSVGLSTEQVQERQSRYGENKLKEKNAMNRFNEIGFIGRERRLEM